MDVHLAGYFFLAREYTVFITTDAFPVCGLAALVWLRYTVTVLVRLSTKKHFAY